MLCCFSPSAVISFGMALYKIYLYVVCMYVLGKIQNSNFLLYNIPGVLLPGLFASPSVDCLPNVLGEGALAVDFFPLLSVESPRALRPGPVAGDAGLCLGDAGRADLGVVDFCR